MVSLACATLSCEGFVDNDFVKTFEILPKIGYRYVEFNCWFPTALTGRKMRDLKHRCETTGLIPAAVYGSNFGGNHIFELARDAGHKLRLIEAACELGCRRIVVTGENRKPDGGLEAIATVLEQIVPFAEEMDILICLENHANNQLMGIDDYTWIFDRFGSSHLGMCMDTGHFDAAGVKNDDVMDKFMSKINHVHIKENIGFGVQNFTMYGEGTTDNVRIVQRMLNQGYSGFVTVELPPRNVGPGVEADLLAAYRMFSKFETSC